MDDRRNDSRGSFSMSFEAGDILMLADALQLAATTAAMAYGGNQAMAAGKRLDELKDRFRALSPLPKSERSTGYAWLAACQAVRDGFYFEAYTTEGRSWGRAEERGISVEVDGKVFLVSEDIPAAEAEACLGKVNAFLSDVAGLDAQRLVPLTVRAALVSDGRNLWNEALDRAVKSCVEQVLPEWTYAIRKSATKYTDMPDGLIEAELVVSVPASLADTARVLFEEAWEAAVQPEAAPAP